MPQKPWQDRAATKRAETLNRIPSEWRLSAEDLEQARQERDITSSFIERFLNEEEVSISSMKSAPILKALAEQRLTTVQVATAFCKRAAVAHQIVKLTQSFCSQVYTD